MGLKTLMARLKCRTADTFETSEKNMGYQRKTPIPVGCTSDTPDTLGLVDSRAILHLQKFGEVVNDPEAAITQPAEIPDPDKWCWPHSSAMTGGELDTMQDRTNLFNQRGLTALDAERLAYALVVRDRDFDDRHLCLECSHLTTGRVMRCLEWQRAGLGHPSVPDSLPTQLQRCEGFSEPK